MKALRGLRLIFIGAGLIAVGTALANLPTVRVSGRAIPVVRADSGCSLASLNCAYAASGQGTIVAQLPGLPAPPAPFGEAALAHFNGAGELSGSAILNIGGVVSNPVTFTGTYAVNNACTGTLTINSNLGLSVHEAIVVL